MNPMGCNRDQLNDTLIFCGFKSIKFPNERFLFFYETKKPIIKTKKINISKKPKNNKIIGTKKNIINKNKKPSDPNSPFAVLEKLL